MYSRSVRGLNDPLLFWQWPSPIPYSSIPHQMKFKSRSVSISGSLNELQALSEVPNGVTSSGNICKCSRIAIFIKPWSNDTYRKEESTVKEVRVLNTHQNIFRAEFRTWGTLQRSLYLCCRKQMHSDQWWHEISFETEQRMHTWWITTDSMTTVDSHSWHNNSNAKNRPQTDKELTLKTKVLGSLGMVIGWDPILTLESIRVTLRICNPFLRHQFLSNHTHRPLGHIRLFVDVHFICISLLRCRGHAVTVPNGVHRWIDISRLTMGDSQQSKQIVMVQNQWTNRTEAIN